MGAPELPPQAPLGTPIALRELWSKPLLPKGWRWLRWPGRKALQQSCVGHQPVEAAGQATGHEQNQSCGHN
jgi:hypothetical protein